LILWQGWQNLFSRIHIASQYRGLVFDDVERQRVPIEVEIFVCEIYTVMGRDVAKEEEWAIIDKFH
jgi:hypothetical protein